jgi:hypothetical protein
MTPARINTIGSDVDKSISEVRDYIADLGAWAVEKGATE